MKHLVAIIQSRQAFFQSAIFMRLSAILLALSAISSLLSAILLALSAIFSLLSAILLALSAISSLYQRFSWHSNKPIAAVCHVAQIFATILEVLKGRVLTAYIACKPEVQVAGAAYIDANLHTDGNLISGHAWPDLPGLMREFIQKLES
ncbi:DJ-1/PfpI family protein [Lysinibacillus sp. NPDC094177]|uniref:DJ-1/PfpI family protein n=1 Tax=Lysinibacillus sp. NPDC094177 TaxID=3390580 RepID=UPI003D079FEC